MTVHKAISADPHVNEPASRFTPEDVKAHENDALL